MSQVRIQVSTRRPQAQVLSTLESLPRRLTGPTPHARDLRSLLLGHFVRFILARISTAYLAKSRGELDELQNSWKRLAPSTIARKLRKRQSQGPSKLHSSQTLTRAQTTLWNRYYAQDSGHFRSQGLKGQDLITAARRTAWQRLYQTKTGSPAAHVPINIDTGRLFAAIQPGVMSGTRYTPPPDQKMQITSKGAKIEFTVPYAGHVHRVRRIYPTLRSMRPWIKDALQDALGVVLTELKDELQ